MEGIRKLQNCFMIVCWTTLVKISNELNSLREPLKFFKNIENIFFSVRQHTYYMKRFGTDSLAIKKGNELFSAK